MDGFAVRAADVRGEALRVLGDAAAGGAGGLAVAQGTAVRISTGAPIPDGADAILRIEDAQVANGSVTPTAGVSAGLHVRHRGEDVHRGDVLARPGDRLTLPRISALASAGVGAVSVHRRPRLHLLVTGDELLPAGAPPEPGKIHESNGLMVRLLAGGVAEITDHGVVGDDRAATQAAVAAGLAGDVLVVTGGVSVGPHDHVKPAFAACGVEEVFWRVQIK